MIKRLRSILATLLIVASTVAAADGTSPFDNPVQPFFQTYSIGRWRSNEQVTGGNGDDPPVNATDKLSDGRTYHEPDEFKHLLAQELDRFAEAFVEQLATYSLRRVMTIDDGAQIKAIVHASKRDDYKLRTVIENLVLSDLFRKR